MMRWMALALFAVAAGCTQYKTVTIETQPVPSDLRIDGVDAGSTPVRHQFAFASEGQTFHLLATRPGYKDSEIDVDRTVASPLIIDLHPLTRRVTFNVLPLPAQIYINGKPLGAGPVHAISTDLDFTLDDQHHWTTYQITASRPGFQPFSRSITFTDPSPAYTIQLAPMLKNVTITTSPSDAQLFLDDEQVGVSPLTRDGMAFFIDPQTNQWSQYKLRATRPGYDPIEVPLSWDDGKTDYNLVFTPRAKTVKITSQPPGAIMNIDGKPLDRDASGASVIHLQFPPIDDKGDLKTYTVDVTKKTAASEWEPVHLTISWDRGQTDYSVPLKEIRTTPIALLSATPDRTDEGWTLVPRRVTTLATKDVNEGAGHEPPQRLRTITALGQLDTLAISPDGERLVFSCLQLHGASDLRSQIMMIKTDGSGGVDNVTDGRSLDVQPTFTPDGQQIVYSSNRGGKRQSIWLISSSGQPGITKLTNGETNDLWPGVDNARQLYYESLIDRRPDPRIFRTELGKTLQTDITQDGGTMPRVSPDSKSILYCVMNTKTSKREIFKMTLKDGTATNLTNAPDSDNFDPAWTPDGERVAFVSDRGIDSDKRHNYDIWIMDLAHPDQPTQLTSNGSWDDCPVWDTKDLNGRTLYFRSNRGGEWAIWKLNLK